jgi:hypothetical protein
MNSYFIVIYIIGITRIKQGQYFPAQTTWNRNEPNLTQGYAPFAQP